jgi:hypothetical protein
MTRSKDALLEELTRRPIRFPVDPKSQAARRPCHHQLIVRETGFQLAADHLKLGIQEIYRQLANDLA